MTPLSGKLNGISLWKWVIPQSRRITGEPSKGSEAGKSLLRKP
jgi:hypothetical protein